MISEKNLRRIMSSLMCCMLALGVALGLAGCGNNAEKLIRADVEEAMEIFKNPTKEKLQPYLEKSGADLGELSEYGIDIYEFCEHAFKHFDYNIDSVKVDGDTATVKLTVRNANLTDAVTKVTEDITSNIGDYAEYFTGEDSEAELYRVIFSKVYDELDKATETVESEATLTYTKDDGAWSVDKESMQVLISKMFGGVRL